MRKKSRSLSLGRFAEISQVKHFEIFADQALANGRLVQGTVTVTVTDGRGGRTTGTYQIK